MVDVYDADNAVIQEVANQALSIESVMGFLNEMVEDPDVESIIMDLADIEIIFDELDFVEDNDESSSENNGVTMLSGGGHLSISEEQFNLLKLKVAELRNSITG